MSDPLNIPSRGGSSYLTIGDALETPFICGRSDSHKFKYSGGLLVTRS